MKTQIEIGQGLQLDIPTLLKTRLLIQANSGGGKSWLIRRLAEQLFGNVPVIVIDPEGEFATLREKFGYVLVGKGGETPADLRSATMVAHKLLELRASAVCDLYELKPQTRHLWVQSFLDALIDAPKEFWNRTVVIVDEAHQYAPEGKAGESAASSAMVDLATRGRKRGYCAVFATQRLGKLRKDAAAELLNVMVGMTFIDIDRERAAECLGVSREDKRVFNEQIKLLTEGKFFCLGRAICKERTLIKVGDVQTTHPEAGGGKFSMEPPPAPEAIKSMLPKLADLPRAAEEKARTESELRSEIRSLKALLSARPKVEVPRVETKEVSILTDEDRRLLKRGAESVETVLASFEKLQARIAENVADTRKFFEPIKSKLNMPLPQLGRAVTTPGSAVVKARAPAPCRTVAPASSNGEFTLTPAQQRILNAAAELHNIEVNPVPKDMLAVHAGQRPTSGGYFNNLGALRTAGLIEYPQPGFVCLTEEGEQNSQPSETRSIGDYHAKWFRLMTPAQARIVTQLIAIYPQDVTKDELAEKSEQRNTSGGYFNNLGALRTMGAIVYPRPGYAKASDNLFPQGLA